MMVRVEKRLILQASFLLIFFIIVPALLWKPLHNLNTAEIISFISAFGMLAPVVSIAIIALQVVFAPIPGQIMGFASGFFFGPIEGTIYCMIGLILGSAIVFWLSRRYGRPLVELFISKKHLEKYDNMVTQKGQFTLFMLYLLPGLPDDAISFIAGLSRIPLPNLILISAMGRLPGFLVLNYVGEGFATHDFFMSIVVFILALPVSVLFYIYREKIENLLVKILHKHV